MVKLSVMVAYVGDKDLKSTLKDFADEALKHQEHLNAFTVKMNKKIDVLMNGLGRMR